MHAAGHLHLHSHNQSCDYGLSKALSAEAGIDQIKQNDLLAVEIAFDTAEFLLQASAKASFHLTDCDCLTRLTRNEDCK